MHNSKLLAFSEDVTLYCLLSSIQILFFSKKYRLNHNFMSGSKKIASLQLGSNVIISFLVSASLSLLTFAEELSLYLSNMSAELNFVTPSKMAFRNLSWCLLRVDAV